MATFITSKSVGQDIYINVNTSTSYWKYNHNGSDSSVFSDGNQTITVANANGEFTIIPCLSNGTVSGDITVLYLQDNQLTSFDGTDLSGLTHLYLYTNQLTSFDGTDLTSLTTLILGGNQLTSFDGTGLTSLYQLDLGINQLTSFDGTGLTSLYQLGLDSNQLTSFDGTGLTSLYQLGLGHNQITSLDGFIFPTSLTFLNLIGNNLTSLDVSPMVSLTNLYLANSYGTGGNPMTAVSNNSILDQLNANGVENGNFFTINGRTSAGTADYDSLIAKGWNLIGLDLPTPPPSGNGKLRIKGVNSGGGTAPTSKVYTLGGFDVATAGGFINTMINQYVNANSLTWDGTYNFVVNGEMGVSKSIYFLDNDGYKHLLNTTLSIPLHIPLVEGEMGNPDYLFTIENGVITNIGNQFTTTYVEDYVDPSTTTTTTIPSSPLFTNITLGGTISFGSPNSPKSTYYRQLTFDYDSTILAANMDEGSTYEIVMITTSNYFSENTIAGISSMDIGGTTYYRGNAHKVGVQGVGAKGSVTILTAQWSNSNPNTLIVDTPNNLVGNYTPFTLTTWRFALIKDGNYVNGTLSSQSFLGSELDAF